MINFTNKKSIILLLIFMFLFLILYTIGLIYLINLRNTNNILKKCIYKVPLHKSVDDNIINELLKRESYYLIPYKGILGGTPGFYDENGIFAVSDNIVLAYWDDGHIGGYVILQYAINNNTFYWEVINSYIDE